MQVDWQDAQADIILFVRSEAAGMVTGKQGAQNSMAAGMICLKPKWYCVGCSAKPQIDMLTQHAAPVGVQALS